MRVPENIRIGEALWDLGEEPTASQLEIHKDLQNLIHEAKITVPLRRRDVSNLIETVSGIGYKAYNTLPTPLNYQVNEGIQVGIIQHTSKWIASKSAKDWNKARTAIIARAQAVDDVVLGKTPPVEVPGAPPVAPPEPGAPIFAPPPAVIKKIDGLKSILLPLGIAVAGGLILFSMIKKKPGLLGALPVVGYHRGGYTKTTYGGVRIPPIFVAPTYVHPYQRKTYGGIPI